MGGARLHVLSFCAFFFFNLYIVSLFVANLDFFFNVFI